MRETETTVAVPTYNRASYLRTCLESVLAQTHSAVQVLVLDNASGDATRATVSPFASERVRYVRHAENIGMLRNWNRALALADTPYVSVFGDDDAMEPAFLTEAAAALDEHPSAGFAFAGASVIDGRGRRLGSRDAGDVVPGFASGAEYLRRVVDGRKVVIHPSSVVMRRAAALAVGGFGSPHSRHTFDFNLFLRLAAEFDVVFLAEELVRVRAHGEQAYEAAWRAPGATGPLADAAERIDAASYLVASEANEDGAEDRVRLARRLRALNARRSEFTSALVPGLLDWEERLALARDEIDSVVPAGARVVLVDDGRWGGPPAVGGARAVPLLEREGEYWGPAGDAETAVRELERLRGAGYEFVVFGWPSFWWLETFPQLEGHLRLRYRCVLENDRLAVFDLR